MRQIAANTSYHWKLGRDEVHVWTISLDQVRVSAGRLIRTLSARERNHAQRLRRIIDRWRYVRSHAAAREILGGYLGVAPSKVAIHIDELGKPRIDSRRHSTTPSFSLSHSGDVALLAVGRCNVGIDVERESSMVDCDAVVRCYFSPAEAAAYFSLPSQSRPRAFFAAWTLKEAYLKACGDGLSRRLDSFTVTMRPELPPRLHVEDGQRGAQARYRLMRLSPAYGYVASMAVAARKVRVRERSWIGMF